MKYDVVIIGSGLGGLTCGCILGRHGYRVAVLEKNARIGGCMQSFSRDGVLFDTGMHYIGSVEPGDALHQFWKYLGVLPDVTLRKLDPEGYDVIQYGGERYSYAMGFDNFAESLAQRFPAERQNLREYVRKIQMIGAESPLYNLHELPEHELLESEYVKTSVSDYIASLTADPVLQNVLAGNLPLYAGVKDKTPLYIHALINNSYIRNCYRRVGGGDAVARSLARSIRAAGGGVFTNSEVASIDCSDKGVSSVTLSTGEKIEGKQYISDIHPAATVRLLDTPLIRRAYRERIEGMENTVSNFTVYICFREGAVPYMNSNFYAYDRESVWGGEQYTQESWPHNYLYMHQAPTGDPGYAEGALLIAYMRWDEVARWHDTKVGRRGEDYEDFKRAKAEKLLGRLERDFPGIRASIRSYTTSTPLTYRDYTATKDGSLYGVLRDKNFPVQTLVSQRTRIPNLFLTGQNVNAHGVLGVTIGSVITCSEFLGINNIIREIKNT